MLSVKLIHKLVDASAFIFEELTDRYSSKEIANGYWKYCKKKFLTGSEKVKMAEYAREILFTLNAKAFQKKYKINVANIKKSKAQSEFVSNCLVMILKSSNTNFLD